MLWIALHLPQLPLQALRWSEPGLEAALPLGVVEQQRLLGANRAAQALGVRAGQSAATALALLPRLVLLPRDAAQEAAFVEQLTLALATLTPHLCPQADGVLIEVQASLRLFGGLRRLLRRARELARGCGAQVRLACAPTANAAWLLALGGLRRRRCVRIASCARRLDPVPLGALAGLLTLSPSHGALLEALGLRTLGELRALPRSGLQRRFGPALALALDRAYGLAPDPRPWFEPRERFALKRELLQRADSAEVLVAAVNAMLPSLLGWLQLRWQAATVLVLGLAHEARRHDANPPPETLLWLQLATPSRDLAQLALLWRERLQRHALVAPVYELTLVLEASLPHGGRPGELLPGPAQAADERSALLERLVARLGPERVQRWQPLPDHRPERAQRARSAHEPAAAMPADAAPPRPAWLLPMPLPLGSDALGRPLHDGPLHLCSKAERIEAGWHDGALVRRDYHVAEGRDHRLRWVYREHRAVDVAGPGGWFLHGWFG